MNIGTSENAKTAFVIAKEFVAAQTDEPGVLLLSKFCGAAETMQRAIIINPYDLQNTAAAIVEALEMPLEERIARRDDLMVDIRESTVRSWFQSCLHDITSVRSSDQQHVSEMRSIPMLIGR